MKYIMLLAGLLSAVMLIACGGNGNATNESAGADDGEATAELQKLYEGEAYSDPPSNAPTPADDKSIYMISCGQATTICAEGAQAVSDAGQLLGWETNVFDSKLDPTEAGKGIRSAIAAKADAIVLHVVDCDPVKAPLEEAERAGILVVAFESLDCDETTQGSESLFDAAVTTGVGPYSKFIERYGSAGATWLIDKTAGQGRIIAFTSNENQALTYETKGFMDQMATCADCEVYDTPFKAAEIGPPLQQRAEQALLKHPDADGVWVPYDGLITSGVGAAIQSSGRADDLNVIGGEGLKPNMDLVREGIQQDAGVALPVRWEGFAAVDALIRLFAGEEPENAGYGIQVYDQEHNMPESGGWEAPIDFEDVYRSSWGVK